MSVVVSDVEIVDVTNDEAFARFDRVCQARLKMSGSEFVEHYQAGKFDGVDVDSIEGLSKVLSILPFAGIDVR
ncbi:hypothetical protein CCUG60884_01422 [Mycobacteroides salmoniphilum]|uniref:Uncharacterized protein n=1 Tax=Mycobacteroides salmoniphilum TaxID=404941 RepID=A0A4R8SVD3_9MYCO|nr:hypothetical protein CCUG60884_01422 [Mycobacteroides salmoniphilum]